MSSWKWLAFIFLNMAYLFCCVKSQNYSCGGNGNYTSNSTYRSNLNTLLSSFSSNIDSNGFFNASMGEDSDRVNVIAHCRGDVQLYTCRSCINNATRLILQLCPYQKQAIYWAPSPGDSCMLRYSNESIFGKPETVPNFDVWIGNVTSSIEFYNDTSQPAPPPPQPVPVPPIPVPPGNDDNTTRTIIIIIVAIVAGLILALSIGIIIRMRRKSKPQEKFETNNEISTVESLHYDFGTIRAATNNFSYANKLGQGGFGVVYKGKLPSGQEIAVKRLSMNSWQGDLEFKNEVLLMAKLQHRNLVRLLGFSLERSERLLVYEFVENGSLDRFIFDLIKRQYLDWDTRYKIIGGVAKGVLYLHEDSRLRIIHRDLKASNVLIDGEMNPKISDFGMARLFDQDETQDNTSRIVGTYGYMAPEYAMHGHISSKSDVFNFGVLVLEIISGQKTSSFQYGENVDDLLSCAWKNWHEGTSVHIIDPSLRTSARSLHDIMRCIHIGLLCVQEDAADRPTMSTIVLMLTSFSITLPIPSRPAFFVSSRFGPEISLLQEQNSRSTDATESSKNRSGNSTDASINDVSMSDLYPR